MRYHCLLFCNCCERQLFIIPLIAMTILYENYVILASIACINVKFLHKYRCFGDGL